MKPTRTCSIDGCERPHLARGMCSMHWQRAKASGTLHTAPRRHYMGDPDASFAARTEWQGDCLIWTGSTDGNGYGRIVVHGTTQAVHRFAWERVNGPIPSGTLVDHRDHCNIRCCNVDHLRLATRGQNNSNKRGPRPDNKSTGVRNVYPTRNGKFKVMIGHQGEQLWYGVHPTLNEAKIVAAAARKELFGEYAGKG